MSHYEPGRARPLSPGATIDGGLTILRHLGGGGLSEVYLVWSARYDATFACKLLRSSFCDDRAGRRALLREGQILRAVAHPGIVRLFEVGRGVQPYLLLQYLAGPSAAALLGEHGRFPVESAVGLALHVATALRHVHRCGYLHLDLKPSNVLVTGGQPILLDFSLARRQQAGRPAFREGTPPYMAPEQCLRRQLTPATDVFGLGCLLYELVSGEPPFLGAVRCSDAALEVRYPQLLAEPVPLEQRVPDVPPELAAIVRRCLHRDPMERYPGMADVLEALASLLGDDRLPRLLVEGGQATEPGRMVAITPRAGRPAAAPGRPA